MNSFGRAGAAAGVPSASATGAGLRLELPVVVVATAPAFLLSESGTGVLTVRSQEGQLGEASPHNPGPLRFGLLKTGRRFASHRASAIFLDQFVEEPVRNICLIKLSIC